MNAYRYVSVLFSFLSVFWVVSPAGATALDDYVALEDPSYGWTIASTQTFNPGGVVYNLDLTSQTWRSSADVNRSVWQHRLNIAVPNNRVRDIVLLIVEGGSNTSQPTDISEYAYISTLVGCAVALLQTVPNQPLRFYNPTTALLSEDNAIGHTYDKYLNAFVEGEPHPDPTWPLLLPMVKSAVKAMDAIQECLAQHDGANVTRFIVGGASKRGWTTWLTAAVDERVVGIVPVVIDILGMDRQLAHHKNAYSSYPATSSAVYMYGGYSTAIRPYTERNIFTRLETPAGEDLRNIVDPYSYRDRLTMPKLIVNSTGDQFFLPDGIQFYFNQLPGKNHIYYVPNTDHGLGIDTSSLDVIYGLLNFVRSFYSWGTPMPEYAWHFERDGSIRVIPEEPPVDVWLWQAHAPNHRDFRLQTLGHVWQRTPLTTRDESGAYIAEVPVPDSGWTGFYVQMDFDTGMSLCSGLRVLPETYANDAAAPDIFGPEFVLHPVTPLLAREGVTIEISVEVSEALSGPPVLTVNGVPALLQSFEDSQALFAYTVQQTDLNGPAEVACYGDDVFDNPGNALFPAAFVIDTLPPQTVDISVTPALARPGEQVLVKFDVSEALEHDPTVTVNGRNATCISAKDMMYTYAYLVDEMDPPGYAALEITLSDLAGNVQTEQHTGILEFGSMLPLKGAALVFALLLLIVLYRSSVNAVSRGFVQC